VEFSVEFVVCPLFSGISGCGAPSHTLPDGDIWINGQRGEITPDFLHGISPCFPMFLSCPLPFANKGPGLVSRLSDEVTQHAMLP